jgi:hypothetical protein
MAHGQQYLRSFKHQNLLKDKYLKREMESF